MGAWRSVLAVGLLAGATLLGSACPPAVAGQGRPPLDADSLVLRSFQTGVLEYLTNRFLPVGGKDGTDVHRRDVLLFTFSEPVHWDSVNDRTLRIGIPTQDGLIVKAIGSFYRYDEYGFDPISGTFVLVRRHRNCVLFDPTSRLDSPIFQNPSGFVPDSPYTVTIPGADRSPGKTLWTRDGRRFARTFRTTFRTGSDTPLDWDWPRLEGVEATDAPGVPLGGRTDVDPHAAIVARFSKPVLPPSFVPGDTFRVINTGTWKEVRVTVEASPDLTTYTFRPPRRGFPASGSLRFILGPEIADRSGATLYEWTPGGTVGGGAWLNFGTAAGN